MITDKKQRHVQTEGVLETADFHIDDSAMGHITAILSNMYSDAPLAVLREYFSNGYDAHVLAGIPTRPVEIKLPTKLDPVYSQRDYGPGLSSALTKELLGGYGASGEEKRKSNAYNGGFGIGAKVGFAVSSAFNYTVYHEGIKRVWSCYQDENDKGKLARVAEVPSSEPSGIEITIPVAEAWVDGFQAAADRAFLFAPVAPKITGMPSTHQTTVQLSPSVGEYHINTEVDGSPAKVRIQLLADLFADHENTPSHADDDKNRLVVGNAGYEIDLAKLGIAEKFKTAVDTLLPYIRIVSPIGFVQVAPSREALQYSQRTIKVLRGLLEALVSPKLGIALVESVAGVKVKDANCRQLAAISLGLDRLYGKGQATTVTDQLATRYTDWLRKGDTDLGITLTLPNSTLMPLLSLTAITGVKCRSMGIRIERYTGYRGNQAELYQARRVSCASLLANSDPRSPRYCPVDVGILQVPTSDDAALLATANIAVARHALQRNTPTAGQDMGLILLVVPHSITPMDGKLADGTLAGAPWVVDGTVKPVPHTSLLGSLAEGESIMADEYSSAYRYGNNIKLSRRAVRSSWSSRSTGPSKVVAHSRKFCVPSDTIDPTAGKASDLWAPALAAEVTDNPLIYIPLDEYRIVNPSGSCMITRSIFDTAVYLTKLSHPSVVAVFDEFAQDCRLVGVRVGDVGTLKGKSGCTNIWEAGRLVLGKAVQADPAFADAVLVRLALDGDSVKIRAFLKLMCFIRDRNLHVPWFTDAVRWADAYERAECYSSQDGGLLRLATAANERVSGTSLWDDRKTGQHTLLGNVVGTCLEHVAEAWECERELREHEDTHHPVVRLWVRAVQEYPMLPYIIPAITDYCGHDSPFGTADDRTTVVRPRVCYVTFKSGSVGEDYLENYLRLVPPLTADLSVRK